MSGNYYCRVKLLSAIMPCVLGVVSANDIISREDSFSKGKAIIDLDGRAKVSLDRRDAIYRCGEEAVFTVTIFETNGVKATSGKVSWTLDNYGAHKFGENKVNLAKSNPFMVKGTLQYPGFLRVTVRNERGKRLRQYSAAYEPERIRTAVPKPDDFDAFWDSAVARLEKEVPLDPQIKPLPALTQNGIAAFRVSFATFGGRVYGILAYPTDQKKGPYPVQINCPGAGPGFSLRRCRGERGKICLYMSVHGFPIQDTDEEAQKLYDAQEAKYRAIHGPSRARAYPIGGFTVSREAAHYFPVVLGINRAVDWVAKRSDVDPKRIVYTGASQGGGFGLYLAALNRHIVRAYIGVPALTDILGCKVDGRQSGWPRILESETQKDSVRLGKIEETARYFDAAYFAERIMIPVRLSVGYADESCAPHAVCAAYNAIPSKDKKLYHGIGGLHGSNNAPQKKIDRFLAGKD